MEEEKQSNNGNESKNANEHNNTNNSISIVENKSVEHEGKDAKEEEDERNEDMEFVISNIKKRGNYSVYKEKLVHYKMSMKVEIMTIRYTNEMANYYFSFLEKNKNKLQCAYGSISPISSEISEGRKIYVLEMNNDQNKIMGIGRICMISAEKAKKYHAKYYIYPKMSMLEKHNRYLYFGTRRIMREHMNEVEENIMKILDIFCFRGNGSVKRGIGITHFPVHILYQCSKILRLEKFIDMMFEV
jgi:hypothetical protein